MTCELCDGPIWSKPHWVNGRLVEICADCADAEPDDDDSDDQTDMEEQQ